MSHWALSSCSNQSLLGMSSASSCAGYLDLIKHDDVLIQYITRLSTPIKKILWIHIYTGNWRCEVAAVLDCAVLYMTMRRRLHIYFHFNTTLHPNHPLKICGIWPKSVVFELNTTDSFQTRFELYFVMSLCICVFVFVFLSVLLSYPHLLICLQQDVQRSCFH